MAEFEPKMLLLSVTGAPMLELILPVQAVSNMHSNVRIIRFPCTGRIDYMLLIKLLDEGADGIIVSGLSS